MLMVPVRLARDDQVGFPRQRLSLRPYLVVMRLVESVIGGRPQLHYPVSLLGGFTLDGHGLPRKPRRRPGDVYIDFVFVGQYFDFRCVIKFKAVGVGADDVAVADLASVVFKAKTGLSLQGA